MNTFSNDVHVCSHLYNLLVCVYVYEYFHSKAEVMISRYTTTTSFIRGNHSCKTFFV